MRILYDNQENKEAVYQLWQEAFHDPEAFAEYYFQWVYPKNQVVIAKESEMICSMLHLNPYVWKWRQNNQTVSLHYIVGVATRENCRRQGLMAACMKKALRDMEAQGEPFTYLMPANPAYYTPFQFVMFKESCKNTKLELPKSNYSIYPERSDAYCERLQAEAQCEEGDFRVLGPGFYVTYVVDRSTNKIILQQVFRDMEIAAYRPIEAEQAWQDFIEDLKCQYVGMEIERIESQPMMLRILNLQRFLELLPYEWEMQVLEVRIKDEICPINSGSVRIILSTDGCRLERFVPSKKIENDNSILATVDDTKADLPEWDMAKVTEYLLKASNWAEQVYLMEIV